MMHIAGNPQFFERGGALCPCKRRHNNQQRAQTKPVMQLHHPKAQSNGRKSLTGHTIAIVGCGFEHDYVFIAAVIFIDLVAAKGRVAGKHNTHKSIV